MKHLLQFLDADFVSSQNATILLIVWAIIFGIILSFFFLYYKRRVIGSFIRAIREAEAVDEQSAKTLSELGQEYNVSATAALKKSSSLRRLITVYNTETTDANQEESCHIDENTRFYISRDGEERSRIQYGDKKESAWSIFLGSAVFLAIGIVVSIVLIR